MVQLKKVRAEIKKNTEEELRKAGLSETMEVEMIPVITPHGQATIVHIKRRRPR